MTHRKLNWKNIIHGTMFLIIITAVIMLMSIDWGELLI